MPWTITKNAKGEYCVFKENAEGEAIGETLGCHATKAEADDQLAALYANEENMMDELTTRAGTVRAEILTGAFENHEATEAALKLINERHAKTPLGASDVYLFRAEMSNQNLDVYFTRMADSSLTNYASDARLGVPLMNSHRVGGMLKGAADLPIGRSYWGELAHDGDNTRLLVDHYVLRGWSNGSGLESDDLIRGIEAGVIRDASIGFGGAGWFRCSICGADMVRGQKCKHLPGLRYEIDKVDTLAFAWVENASLIEDSLVYRGATPNAGVLRKAGVALREGWADHAQIRYLEEQYHVRILGTTYSVPANVRPAGEELEDMELEQVRAAFPGVAGVEEAETVEAVVEAVAGEIEASRNLVELQQDQVDKLTAELGAMQAQVEGLQPRAERGDAWLADLIGQTVEARVRVQGSEFNADQYRDALAQLGDVDYIRSELASWEKLAKDKFTAGRQMGPQPKAPKAQQGEKRDPAQYRA